MTARIKTEAEARADLEAELAALGLELAELEARGQNVKQRLTELRSKLDAAVCPCAACATAGRYATNARGDDGCGYCGATDDTHDDDCKPSYRTPALLSQDEADLVEKLTGTRYES